MGGVRCCLCGRFVGPDGRLDVGLDPYTGCAEEGYSYCGPCLRDMGQDGSQIEGEEVMFGPKYRPD